MFLSGSRAPARIRTICLTAWRRQARSLGPGRNAGPRPA